MEISKKFEMDKRRFRKAKEGKKKKRDGHIENKWKLLCQSDECKRE